MSIDNIDNRIQARHKREWSRLRGQGYALAYRQADFLHGVLMDTLHGDEANFRMYMEGVLEEFRGKRISAFLRWAQTFEVDNNRERWHRIGPSGMVLLVRVDGRRRGNIMRAVGATLRRTGRACVSEGTFREILRRKLGAAGYRQILTEGSERANGGDPRMTYRQQCVILQGALLRLLKNHKIVARDLQAPERILLGLQTGGARGVA